MNADTIIDKTLAMFKKDPAKWVKGVMYYHTNYDTTTDPDQCKMCLLGGLLYNTTGSMTVGYRKIADHLSKSETRSFESALRRVAASGITVIDRDSEDHFLLIGRTNTRLRKIITEVNDKHANYDQLIEILTRAKNRRDPVGRIKHLEV